MIRAVAIFLVVITMLAAYPAVQVMDVAHAKKEKCCADSNDAKACKERPIKKEKNSCKKECSACSSCLQVCWGMLPATAINNKRHFALSLVPYGRLVQNKLSGFSFDVWKPPRV